MTRFEHFNKPSPQKCRFGWPELLGGVRERWWYAAHDGLVTFWVWGFIPTR